MRSRAIHAAICVLVSLILCGCDPTYNPNKPLPNTQNLPIYPGATGTKVEKRADGASTQIITFQTRDSPSDVLAFYQATLVKDGWEQTQNSTSNSLQFGWQNGSRNPGYGLQVTAGIDPGGQTNVILRLVTYYRE